MNSAPDSPDAAMAPNEEISRNPSAFEIGTTDASRMSTTAPPVGIDAARRTPQTRCWLIRPGARSDRALRPAVRSSRRRPPSGRKAAPRNARDRHRAADRIFARDVLSYFKDVEDVVLYLASQAKETTPALAEIWRGLGRARRTRAGQAAREPRDRSLEKYAPVLRARNNASDEGHPALRDDGRDDADRRSLSACDRAVPGPGRGGVEAATSFEGGHVDPFAGATTLASCLERTSMYLRFVKRRAAPRARRTAAVFLQGMLTSRR